MKMYHWAVTTRQQFDFLVLAEDVGQARIAIGKQIDLWPDKRDAEAMRNVVAGNPLSVKDPLDVVVVR